MINHKDIIKSLPGSWKEMKLKDFQKVMDITISENIEQENIFDGLDNTIKVISSLTSIPVADLEELPMKEMIEVTKQISFITEIPGDSKACSLKWKQIDKISYDDFVTFNTLAQEPLVNLVPIIKTFSVDKLSDEQVLDLNMEDVFTGFFLLNRQSKKFIRHTNIFLKKKLMKQVVVEMLSHFRQKLKGTGRKSKKHMGGSS